MEDYQKYGEEDLGCIVGEIIIQLPEDSGTKYLLSVFQRLPKDVVDYIQDNIAFMFIDTSYTFSEGESNSIRDKKLIVFYMGNEWEEEYQDTIVHEIAHAYLGDAGSQKGTIDKQRKIETEADDLIEKWGFTRRYSEERENLF